MTAPSPADDRIVAARPGGGTATLVLRTILLSCAVATIFGSHPLLGAANGLPDGAAASVLRRVAADWDGLMGRIGATLPYDGLRATLHAFAAWHAPG